MSNNSISIFKNYNLLQVLLYGIISGMPFAVLYTTIGVWMAEAGLSIAVITTFGFAKGLFSLKFLWAPFVDGIYLPVLSRLFGHRRSWMFIMIVCNSITIFLLSQINPLHDTLLIRVMTLMLALFGATYDIAYDAMRIEMLREDEQTAGISITTLGWRIGATTAGSLVIFMSYYIGWSVAFNIITLLFFGGGLFLIFSSKTLNNSMLEITNKPISFSHAIIEPLKILFRLNNIFVVLAGIMLYKLGDAMLSYVSMLFYLDVGFDKRTATVIVKTVGISATILGTYFSAILYSKYGYLKNLIICGIAQMTTNLLYIFINHYPTIYVFIIVNFCENFTGGMGAAALTGYLSVLSINKGFVATQYALLSSIATFSNNTITSSSGMLVTMLGWDYFFILTFLISMPGVIIFMYLIKK